MLKTLYVRSAMVVDV